MKFCINFIINYLYIIYSINRSFKNKLISVVYLFCIACVRWKRAIDRLSSFAIFNLEMLEKDSG